MPGLLPAMSAGRPAAAVLPVRPNRQRSRVLRPKIGDPGEGHRDGAGGPAIRPHAVQLLLGEEAAARQDGGVRQVAEIHREPHIGRAESGIALNLASVAQGSLAIIVSGASSSDCCWYAGGSPGSTTSRSWTSISDAPRACSTSYPCASLPRISLSRGSWRRLWGDFFASCAIWIYNEWVRVWILSSRLGGDRQHAPHPRGLRIPKRVVVSAPAGGGQFVAFIGGGGLTLRRDRQYPGPGRPADQPQRNHAHLQGQPTPEDVRHPHLSQTTIAGSREGTATTGAGGETLLDILRGRTIDGGFFGADDLGNRWL